MSTDVRSGTREREHAATGGGEERLRRSAWRWIRLATILACLWLGYQELLVVQGWVLAILSVVLYVVFGGVLALVAEPAVGALARRGVPRSLAIAAVVTAGVAAVAAVAFWVGLSLLSELHDLLLRVPGWLAGVEGVYRRAVEPALRARGLGVDPSTVLTRATGPAAVMDNLPRVLVATVSDALRVVADAVIVLVICVWLLVDGRRLRDSVAGWLPGRERAILGFALDVLVVVFGGYVRAQLLIALTVGLLAGVGCALLGVPYPVLVAVVAGIFELVPIVGPFAGGAVALLLAASVSWWLVLWTLLLFLGIHAVEGYVLAPRVQARFVRIPPLVAFLALFAGIEAAGFIGALFAIPVASMLAVFGRTLIAAHRRLHPERWRDDGAQPALDEERQRLRDFSVRRPRPRPSRIRASIARWARSQGP